MAEEEERLTTEEYRPQKFIDTYVYPYPTNELVRARSTLIRSVYDWCQKKSSDKLKEKLGIPEKVDNLVVKDLESNTPNFVSNSIPSIKTFDPIMDIVQAQGPSPSSSTSVGNQKRKSDNLIVLGEQKKTRTEPDKISPIKVIEAGSSSSLNPHHSSGAKSASLNNLVTVNIQENTKSNEGTEKRGISPVRIVEAGSSLLSDSVVTSKESTQSTSKSLQPTSSKVSAAASVSSAASSSGTSKVDVSTAGNSESNSKTGGTESLKKPEVDSDQSENKQENESSEKKKSSVTLLRCDYCYHQEHETYRSKMLTHLKTANHYSASIYNGEKNGGDFNVTSVQKPLVVMNKDAQMHSVFVTCPKCPTIFGDIFQCGMHHRYAHSSGDDRYCLVPVSETFTVEFTKSNIFDCKVCKQKFHSLRDSNKHERRKNHFPCHINPDSSIIYLLSCCSKFAINSYFSAKAHIETELVKSGKSNDFKVTLTMKLLNQKKGAMVKKVLPPPQNLDAVHIISTDINHFEDYVNFSKNVLGNSLKANRQELARLKLMKADLEKGNKLDGSFRLPPCLSSK